jgi:hypothetical protein
MPYLHHFTEEQADDIRREIAAYIRPYRIRFYFVLTGFLIFAAIGLWAYQASVDSSRDRVCRTAAENRKVLSDILLLASHPPPDATAEQRERTQAFFDRAQKILTRPVC